MPFFLVNHYVKYAIALVSIFTISGCSSWDPTSPGPQPHYLKDVQHQPMLNIFGILRPDSLGLRSLSYVHLESSYPAENRLDDAIIPDALVQIFKLEGESALDSLILTYTDEGIFPTREYRSSSFFPKNGTYRLTCRRDDFPDLLATTTIPSVPVIQDGRIETKGDILSFKIIRDEQAGLYEVSIDGSNWRITDRFLRPANSNVLISFSLERIPRESCEITIYAFDLNLSEYSTVNLSIKPNIYQKDFSTVENGTGCFGSMNIFRVRIEL